FQAAGANPEPPVLENSPIVPYFFPAEQPPQRGWAQRAGGRNQTKLKRRNRLSPTALPGVHVHKRLRRLRAEFWSLRLRTRVPRRFSTASGSDQAASQAGQNPYSTTLPHLSGCGLRKP